ncbi:unnamed protein product [Gadus morhua 'NCC']
MQRGERRGGGLQDGTVVELSASAPGYERGEHGGPRGRLPLHNKSFMNRLESWASTTYNAVSLTPTAQNASIAGNDVWITCVSCLHFLACDCGMSGGTHPALRYPVLRVASNASDLRFPVATHGSLLSLTGGVSSAKAITPQYRWQRLLLCHDPSVSGSQTVAGSRPRQVPMTVTWLLTSTMRLMTARYPAPLWCVTACPEPRVRNVAGHHDISSALATAVAAGCSEEAYSATPSLSVLPCNIYGLRS